MSAVLEVGDGLESGDGLEVGNVVNLDEWKQLGCTTFECNKRGGGGRKRVLALWPRWLVELELPGKKGPSLALGAGPNGAEGSCIIRESMPLSGLDQIHIPPGEPGSIELRFGGFMSSTVCLMSDAKVRSLARHLQENLSEQFFPRELPQAAPEEAPSASSGKDDTCSADHPAGHIPRTGVHAASGAPAGGGRRRPARRKMVAFDFDNTIAQKQVWSLPEEEVVAKLIGIHRIELLRALFRFLVGRGVTLLVVSMNKRAVIEATLAAMGVRDCFQAILDGNDVKGAKTKQLLMRTLLKKHACDAGDALLVDDDMPNLRGCPCGVVHVTSKRGVGPFEVREVLAKLSLKWPAGQI